MLLLRVVTTCNYYKNLVNYYKNLVNYYKMLLLRVVTTTKTL